MPYIGKTPLTGAYQLCDAITTSATATYNLTVGSSPVIPGAAQNCIVSLNGVIQAPVGAYTVSGSQITFASTLSATDVIDFILILGNVFDIGKPTDGSVTNASVASNAAIALSKLATTGTMTFASTIGVGGATPAASGAGVSFPATQSASSDANTLDDYEEGTFTPILTATSPGASGQVYASRTALYTKIGRYVFCTVDIRLSTKGTFSGSNILLGDLPFTINANSNTGGGSCGYWVNLATNWNSVFLFPIANTATMYITGAKSAVASSDFFASADIAATTEFRFVFSYIV